MAALEERDGVRLDALARMRTRCLDEIKAAEIPDGTPDTASCTRLRMPSSAR